MAEVLSKEEIDALLERLDDNEGVDLGDYKFCNSKIKRINNLKKKRLDRNRYEFIKFNLLISINRRQ